MRECKAYIDVWPWVLIIKPFVCDNETFEWLQELRQYWDWFENIILQHKKEVICCLMKDIDLDN